MRANDFGFFNMLLCFVPVTLTGLFVPSHDGDARKLLRHGGRKICEPPNVARRFTSGTGNASGSIVQPDAGPASARASHAQAGVVLARTSRAARRLTLFAGSWSRRLPSHPSPAGTLRTPPQGPWSPARKHPLIRLPANAPSTRRLMAEQRLSSATAVSSATSANGIMPVV